MTPSGHHGFRRPIDRDAEGRCQTPYTLNRCLLCQHMPIDATREDRVVTTSCPACYATLRIEFDPPDQPELRARIERIDEPAETRRTRSGVRAKFSRAIAIDELTTRPTVEIVPPFDRLDTADHRLSVRQRMITARTQQLWRRRLGRRGEHG